MSYPLLERINAPGEIKNLPASDMPALCEEIRQFLIKRPAAICRRTSALWS